MKLGWNANEQDELFETITLGFTSQLYHNHANFEKLFICKPQFSSIVSISHRRKRSIKDSVIFPGGPLVKTSPSNGGGTGSILGQGTKIPQASQPKTQNRKQKQYDNCFWEKQDQAEVRTGAGHLCMVMGSEGTLQPWSELHSPTKARRSHGFPAVEDQVKVFAWCILGHFEKINKATTSIESQSLQCKYEQDIRSRSDISRNFIFSKGGGKPKEGRRCLK